MASLTAEVSLTAVVSDDLSFVKSFIPQLKSMEFHIFTSQLNLLWVYYELIKFPANLNFILALFSQLLKVHTK